MRGEEHFTMESQLKSAPFGLEEGGRGADLQLSIIVKDDGGAAEEEEADFDPPKKPEATRPN